MDIMNTSISAQLKAALSTLGYAIETCPDADWGSPHWDAPFSQVVFHALFHADFYLGKDSIPFKDQGFHRSHKDVFAGYEELEDRTPTGHYSKAFCLDYLAFCLGKVDSCMVAETGSSLLGESGISFRKGSRLELHIYNARHIQHHAAQLGLRIQMSTARKMPWLARG